MSELIKLSVSKSATFQNCRKKYKYSYILKLPKKEYTYHTFGRFVHRVLELFHIAYIEGSKDSFGKTMSTSFNEAMKEFPDKIPASMKKEAIEVIQEYLKYINTNKEEVFSVKSVEQTFNIHLNEQLILTGMIDRVQIDPDGVYHVLDYKTSKSKTYLKDDSLQLLTYAYVLHRENPEIKKVRVSYIMLRHKSEFITKEFELEDILSIKDIYEKYEKEIRSETEYKASPQRLCQYCDFAGVCEEGKAFMKKIIKVGEISW